jgi:hypothetical protein
MAVLQKLRARSPKAIAEHVTVGYGNMAFQGLLTNKHIGLHIGEFTLRIELDKAKEIAEEILRIEHKMWREK